MPDAQPPASIIVVDDTPQNLKLLDSMLRERGYRVLSFPRGDRALRAAAKSPPDLILLDINMPEMSGYEVCERLKHDERLREIPVIFISALDETLDKVKAFGVGGVDYVTKPFQIEEVEARVRTHLELRRQRRQLEESYDQLRELERLRDSLVHMIVHDMRQPLSGVKAYLQLLARSDGEHLSGKGSEYVQKATASAAILIEMASAVLDVSKMESGEMELRLSDCDLVALAEDAVSETEPLWGGLHPAVERPAQPVSIECDPELIGRVLRNLLDNALKFTPEDGSVRLGIEPTDDRVRVSVRDTGSGIPAEHQARIFEKFGQAETRTQQQKYATGLGLTFCKLAVEAHGGSIGVESNVGEGSTFWFELPLVALADRRPDTDPVGEERGSRDA